MKKFGIFLSFVLSFLWSSIYWFGFQNRWQTDWLASTHLDKPWVYRQLIPLLVRSIPIPTDISTTLIVSLFGVGLYLALCKLLKNDTVSIFFLIIGLALFGYNRIPYDLPTAFLFALSYYLILQKDDRFLWIFPLAVLNRETAFLLVIFYLIYNRFSIKTFYLSGVFIVVQTFLHFIFSGNQGSMAWVTPMQNILEFAHNPARTLLHFSIIVIILFTIFWSWRLHDQKLKLGFLVVSGLCFAMYLIMGQAFEVRVLWEVYPLACVLSIPTLKEIYYEMQNYQKDRIPNRSEG